MQWYYEKDGAQRGPVPEEELRKMVDSGAAGRGTLVWREGMEHWQPANSLPEFAGLTPQQADTAVTGYEPPRYGPPAAAGYPSQPVNGLAIASLVCGIMSVVLLFSCGIGIVVGIPAVICGHMAMGQIQRGVAPAGKGMAIAGLVTGYLAILITLLVGLFFVFVIVVGGSTSP